MPKFLKRREVVHLITDEETKANLSIKEANKLEKLKD